MKLLFVIFFAFAVAGMFKPHYGVTIISVAMMFLVWRANKTFNAQEALYNQMHPPMPQPTEKILEECSCNKM